MEPGKTTNLGQTEFIMWGTKTDEGVHLYASRTLTQLDLTAVVDPEEPHSSGAFTYHPSRRLDHIDISGRIHTFSFALGSDLAEAMSIIANHWADEDAAGNQEPRCENCERVLSTNADGDYLCDPCEMLWPARYIEDQNALEQ